MFLHPSRASPTAGNLAGKHALERVATKMDCDKSVAQQHEPFRAVVAVWENLAPGLLGLERVGCADDCERGLRSRLFVMQRHMTLAVKVVQ